MLSYSRSFGSSIRSSTTMKPAALLLASSAPCALALVYNEWSFDQVPAAGLDDIIFPFNVATAPHKTGFYFAQQFSFKNLPDVGYTGVQPREDKGGAPILHFVFSTFQAGSTTTDSKRCKPGADGGPGVSCAIEIPADYRPDYYFKVANVGGATWRGSVISAGGREMTIGEWTLPKKGGKIQGSQVGFVEYYPWNSVSSHDCRHLPMTEATFGHPLSSTAGARGGRTRKPFEKRDCVGKVGFSVKEVKDGWKVKVGF
ncbi:hypothetical protein L249_3267 [Ophiocordyceps polyrhachis-furcata BCC 54312]|uniref:Uncharacterized protein n=1 Tax=Ophiocordyceps polyrhachis-furcata BCC 54312 TaxID=1330021 RepID=A0A367LNX7_9HYPO|nr:hypothetical protein L249_3267 [Ophiocordyceps polyrhachis-furcata BCC 54312]